MTFQEKINKAFRLRTYTQSQALKLLHALPEQWRKWQRKRIARRARKNRQRVSVENLRRGLNVETLQSIQELGKIKDRADVFWTKYLDVDHWLAVNIKQADALGLMGQPPRDVLDLGCGAGYFLVVCRALGARTLGVDLDNDQVLNGMIRLFGLRRIVKRIHPFVKLPDLGRKFDLITGFMICFNFPTNETHWGEREWDFFLNDLLRYLQPKGRMFLSLNRQPDGELYSEELRQFFLSRGAVIKGKRILLNGPDLRRTRDRLASLSLV